MGIRENLNKNPVIAIGISAVVIVVSAILIANHLFSSTQPKFKPPKAWYTTDEGATWFEGDLYAISPIEHEGKRAVRVYLFKCGQDGQKFAGYLERFTNKAKAEIEKRDPKQRGGMMEEWESEKLVKKPGAEKWFQFGDPQYEEIMTIKCPDGSYSLPADQD